MGENPNWELFDRGGFANVFVDNVDFKQVLKQLKPELWGEKGLAERFKREYAITQSLQDIEGIIPVYDYYPDTHSYLMMRCSMTLKQFLNDISIPDNFIEHIIDTVLSTMEEVHNRGVLHRDLSVSNILLNEVGGTYDIYISDFGLGKDLDNDSTYETQMTLGFGQFAFTAPEQYQGLRDSTKQSDVYSLGKLINYIFTNSPDDTNHKYRKICDRATSRNPKYRQRDAGEMRFEINRQREAIADVFLKTQAYQEIERKILGVNTERYIDNLPPLDLAIEIRDSFEFADAVIWYIEKNHLSHIDSVLSLLENINENSEEVFRTWEDADKFSYFGYCILKNNISYTYEINACAAEILNWGAHEINRYYAQGLIEELEKQGLEPAIEDILNRKSF